VSNTHSWRLRSVLPTHVPRPALRVIWAGRSGHAVDPTLPHALPHATPRDLCGGSRGAKRVIRVHGDGPTRTAAQGGLGREALPACSGYTVSDLDSPSRDAGGTVAADSGRLSRRSVPYPRDS